MYFIGLIYLVMIKILFEHKISKKHFLILSIVPFLIISFIRFGVGPDYFSYEFLYNNLDNDSIGAFIDYIPEFEFGFKVLMLIGNTLNLNYHLFTALVSAGSALIFFFIVNKLEKDYAYPIILYFSMFFVTWNLSAIRQGLAILLAIKILFYSENRFKENTKLLLTAALALLHVSALVIIPIYIFSKKKYTQKNMAIFFGLSILLAFVPYQNILVLFENLPVIGKISNYIPEYTLNIFSISTIIRIIIVSVLLYFYDRIIENENKAETMLNFSLFSFFLFFVLKQSELIASRFSIFGFTLVVFLFPIIFKMISKTQVKKMVTLLAVFVLSFAFLFKDLNTMIFQSGYQKDVVSYSFENIFNEDRANFYNRYNLAYRFKQSCSIEETPKAAIVEAKPQEGDTYLSVYFDYEELYGIINQRGEVVELPQFYYSPKIHGNIVEEKSQGASIKRKEFRYVGQTEYLNIYDILDVVADDVKKDIFQESLYFDIGSENYENYENTILHDLIPENNITYMLSYSFGSPVPYKILEVNVYSYYIYYLMDASGNIKETDVFYNLSPYNKDGFMVGRTACGKTVLNLNGEEIWTEKNREE